MPYTAPVTGLRKNPAVVLVALHSPFRCRLPFQDGAVKKSSRCSRGARFAFSMPFTASWRVCEKIRLLFSWRSTRVFDAFYRSVTGLRKNPAAVLVALHLSLDAPFTAS